MTAWRDSKSGRMLVAAAIVASCIGCDQATKRMATQTLRGSEPRTYLGDTLRLEYSLNPGGFLSLGAQLSPNARFWMFTIFNTAMLVGVSWLLVRRWNARPLVFVAIALFLAGGIGNLIDRMVHEGLVTDFMVLSLGPLHTGVFNVADVAITAGGIVFAIVYRDAAPNVVDNVTPST
jgi:signal peptidase II